ncbi:hypothetical protein HDU96_003793 [Phlyctochytrium bullatum]|nr:hypothetical protein HDU96_003793 [Phlyctochytrium bullatum]
MITAWCVIAVDVDGTSVPHVMSETLSAYVSLYVRKLLSDGEQRREFLETLGKGRPYVTMEEMPVAMVDVSGYSSLTTQLFEAVGKMSSEVISEVIGNYIGKAGDAILVTFPQWSPSDTPYVLKRRAIDCCARILQDLGEYEVDINKWMKAYYASQADGQPKSPVKLSIEYSSRVSQSSSRRSSKQSRGDLPNSGAKRGSTSGGSISTRTTTSKLGIHIGLTFGNISHVIVGSTKSHLDYFLTGSVLSELEALLESSSPGELALPKEAFEEIVTFGKLIQSDDGIELYLATQPDLETAKIPPSLTLDDFNFYYSLDAIPSCDKKYCLHAIQAASAFLTGIKNRNDFAVSIATGESLFTKLGNAQRREAGLLGVVCNTAARLLKISKAENLIALDNTTYEAIKMDCDCVELGFHAVKGWPEPIKVWGVVPEMFFGRLHSSVLPEKNIIGNREEYFAIESAFGNWYLGTIIKDVFLIEGPSGMGKSSLLSQITNVIRKTKTPICIARGSEVDQGRPFCVIRRLAITLIALLNDHKEPIDPDTLAHLTSQLIRQINEDEVHIPLILEWLIPGRGKQYSEVSSIEAKWDAQRLIIIAVAIKMICFVLERKKIVVLLDDFQWIDSASLEAIDASIELSKEMFCIAFSRPLVDFKLKELKDAIHFDERFMLKGLSKDEIRHFMLEALEISSIEESIISTIHERTQGSLLQVDTLVSYFKDNPEYFQENLSNSERLEGVLSKSLEAVIITQFDEYVSIPFNELTSKYRLDSFFQMVLRRASIIGHYIEMKHLLFLMNLSGEVNTTAESSIRNAIKNGDKFGFLVIDDAAEVNFEHVSFRHIKIRNAIYESLPVAVRQQLHFKLAEYYESGSKETEKNFFLPLVCYHYWRSGNVEKLVLKNIEFGLSLSSGGLRIEAASVLDEVFKFMDDQCETAEIEKFLPRELQAIALSELTYSSSLVLPMDVTREYGIRTVEMLAGPWPKTKKEMKRALIRNLFRIIKLLIKTRNGKRDAPTITKDGLDKLRHECLHQALAAIIFVSIYDGNNNGEILVQTLLMMYIYGLEFCVSAKDKYFYAMEYVALMVQRSRIGAAIGRSFQRRCRLLWKDLTLEQRSNGATHISTVTAYLLDTVYARSIYDEAFSYWEVRKASAEVLKMQTFVTYPNYFLGIIRDRTPELIPLANETLKYGPIFVTTLLNVLLYENFTIAKVSSLERVMDLYETVAPQVPNSGKYFAGANESIPRIMGLIFKLDRVKKYSLVAELKAFSDYMSTAPLRTNTTRGFFASLLITIGCFVAVKRSAGATSTSRKFGGPSELADLVVSLRSCQRAYKKASYFFLGLSGYHMVTAAICHPEGNKSAKSVVRCFKNILASSKFKGKFCEDDYFRKDGWISFTL